MQSAEWMTVLVSLAYKEVFSLKEFHVFEQPLPEPGFDMKWSRFFAVAYTVRPTSL